nr:hypothetical protein [Nostoc sp. DedSLP05]MDZ8101644.1 hypothetical protein [Nostoc sp. DedSLP01]
MEWVAGAYLVKELGIRVSKYNVICSLIAICKLAKGCFYKDIDISIVIPDEHTTKYFYLVVVQKTYI